MDEQYQVLEYKQAAKIQLLKLAHINLATKTGFPAVDRYLTAFLPESTTVVGAEASVGKTTFVANIAANVASQQQKKVIYFSLESGVSISKLIACYLKRKKEEDITDKELTEEMPNLKIVAPNEMLSLSDIEKISYQNEAGLIILDHIHYLLKPSNDLQGTIASTMRGLQTLARRLKTHILIVSHLKKPESGKENEIPSVYRLKDSSSLYQDPSNVILLSRRRKSVEFLDPGEDVFEQTGILIVAKNRDFGRTGIARFYFNKELHSFDFDFSGGEKG